MILLNILGADLISALAFLVAYFSAILVAMSFHEASHAFVAYKQGDNTAKAMKRLTLKPFSHVDTLGFICLLIFGFGWAKPVPVDTRNLKNGRKSEFLVSIAGISMNLIIALIASFVYCLLYFVWPAFSASSSFYLTALNLFLNFTIIINLSFVFFNILPIYPLDGFRMVESFSGKTSSFSNFMRKYSQIILILLYITSLFSLYINFTAVNLSNLFVQMWSKLFSLLGL